MAKLSSKISAIYSEIKALNKSGYSNKYKDQSKGLQLSQSAYDLNESLPPDLIDQEGKVDSLNNITWFNLFFTNYYDAYLYAIQALELAQEHNYSLGQARAFGHLGRIRMYWGNYAESLECHNQQLAISTSIKYEPEMSIALNYLGNLYSRLEKPIQSIDFYSQAILIDEKLGNLDGQATKLINSAMVMTQLNQTDQSLENALKGLTLAKEIENRYLEAWALGTISRAYRKKGDISLAILYISDHYELAKELKDKQQQLDALIGFGDAYYHSEDYERALSYLNDALTLANDNNFVPHQNRCYKKMAAVCKKMGEFEKAIAYFELYHKQREELFSIETAEKLQQLERSYQVEDAKKEAEILRLKTIELEQMVESRTAALTQLNAELNRSVNRELELNTLKSQIITTVSHEFRTPLTAIKVSVDLLRRHIAQLSEAKQDQIFTRINESISYLGEMIQQVLNVDSIDSPIVKPVFLSIEFGQFVIDLKKDIEERFGPHADYLMLKSTPFQGDVVIGYIELRQILFYIIENGLKFSNYQELVTIEISADGATKQLCISVTDSGIGIPEDELENVCEPFYRCSNARLYRGLGLSLFMVKQLISKLDGKVSFQSDSTSSDIVTVVTLMIPFAEMLDN
ncbi:MAG: tetratricopeptide repeat protein [Anaerolineae bacterium]